MATWSWFGAFVPGACPLAARPHPSQSSAGIQLAETTERTAAGFSFRLASFRHPQEPQSRHGFGGGGARSFRRANGRSDRDEAALRIDESGSVEAAESNPRKIPARATAVV